MNANPMPARLSHVVALVGLSTAVAVQAQPCQPFWVRGFPSINTSYCQAFDDGSGSAVFAFWPDHGMYRWREGEASWASVQTGLPNNYGASQPTNFLVLDDGSGPKLCFFGHTRVGPGPEDRQYWIARWNGATWDLPWPAMTTGTNRPYFQADLGHGPVIFGVSFIANQSHVLRWINGQWEDVSHLNGRVR